MSKVFSRILCATDFSKASAPAFKRAVQLAAQNSAELTLVHVLSLAEPMASDVYLAPQVYMEVRAAARNDAQKRLKRASAQAGKSASKVRAVLAEGSPFEEILRIARSRRCDLIVLGTHGRSGFTKLLAGSVAERVVRLAGCPVLTVRAH